MTTLTLSYYPDITQKQTNEDIHNAIVVFADAVGEHLSSHKGKDFSVNVLPVMSVSDQYQHTLDGNAHIALMKPVAYVLAHHQRSGILPACVAHRPIDGKVGTDYFAQIYARRDLGMSSLKDLAKREPESLRIAYGNRFSTSNFLIPASTLARAGIHPFLFFKSAEFFGGHDYAAEAVYEGKADIGAGHDGVIKILAESQPDADSALISLGREFIHSDPVVVDSDVLPDGLSVQDLRIAFSSVAKTPPVQKALDLFWGWVKDLSATEHANYSSIEDALARLHLSEEDLLN